jgi:hypothetical protein
METFIHCSAKNARAKNADGQPRLIVPHANRFKSEARHLLEGAARACTAQ